MSPRGFSAAVVCVAAASLLVSAGLTAHAGAPSSMVRSLDHVEGGDLDALFRAELADAAKEKAPVVVMFTADWCTPCRSLKTLFEGSAVVKRAAGKGRVLLIDVDDWRGPAHRLIPGENPDKLPLLVSVDADGRSRVSCYGTELGLLTEEATAQNLARLFRGEAPKEPDYMSSPDKEREAMREFAAREKAASPEGQPATARLEDGGATVRLTLQNHDARRLWFVVPLLPGDRVPDAPAITAFAEMKFDEHVRATWLRAGGDHPFIAIPVAGNGSVDISGVWLPGLVSGARIAIRAVDRLTLDATPLEFQKKLPYALRIERAASTPLTTRTAPVELRLVGGKVFEAVVSAP
ncbi:MAG: thioredoxin family protein [Myxococcota bacterium]